MKKLWIVLLFSAVVLSACGGGSVDTPAPPPVTQEVPPGASASVAGLMTYLKALVAAPADTLEPVDVSALTPLADESGEPAVVD